MRYNREFLTRLDRAGLLRAVAVLRLEQANRLVPAAAQYDGLATLGSLAAEFRRRGWKYPKAKR